MTWKVRGQAEVSDLVRRHPGDILTLVEDLSVSGLTNPVRIFTRVVLPAPLGPITPRTSP